MQINIPKPVFADMKQDLSASPFSVREDGYRFNTNAEMCLDGLNIQELRSLFSIFERCAVRGAKTLARDVNTWIKATTRNGVAPRARRTSQGTSLLWAYLSQFPKHHVFAMNQENAETGVLAYYVESITYHPRNDRNDSPECIIFSLAYQLFGEIQKITRTLYYGGVIGKTAEEMLAHLGLFSETESLLTAYRESVDRYDQLHSQVGLQLDAVGYADDQDIDCEGSRSSYRSVGRWQLGSNGEPSRLVVDAFRESDKEQNIRDAHVYSSYWNMKIKWVNGEAEALDEDDDEPDVSHPMEIPIHPYLVCFDLRKHRRMRVHVSSVTEYVYNEGLRDLLSLPESHGALIDTLLSDRVTAFQDVVKNKSGGIITLLQGTPGTGKTLTAEVYAESLKRPLYSVQCSQLGIEVDEVEGNLMLALARGRRWNAVMLLDEADVYVSARGDDLVRNAIVGVFLRVLEYHAGVLFLTTNRGDCVDDAILSRCTARIVYTTPDVNAQQQIWKNLCKANGVKITDKTIGEIVRKHSMSGRDIRNILKLCVAVGEDRGESISAALVEYVKQFKPTSSGETP